jgi:hypothetical protein
MPTSANRSIIFNIPWSPQVRIRSEIRAVAGLQAGGKPAATP